MIRLSNKAKHYGLIALKVFILTATIWFIYERLSGSEGIVFDSLISTLTRVQPSYIFGIIFLVIANWFFEILKWKSLVDTLQSIRFEYAYRQCLTAIGAALATLNRVGEYGAKALFFPKRQRKKILVLNLVNNTSQMAVTLLFGIPGLFFFILKHGIVVNVGNSIALVVLVLILVLLGYLFRKQQIVVKGLSISNLFRTVRAIPPGTRWKVFGYAMLRYLIFSAMFMIFLSIFGIHLEFWTSTTLITTMYLLASLLPSFAILDVTVKGGVALWLFSFVPTSEVAVLSTSLCMWLLNIMLPALIGMVYVVKFKPVTT